MEKTVTTIDELVRNVRDSLLKIELEHNRLTIENRKLKAKVSELENNLYCQEIINRD